MDGIAAIATAGSVPNLIFAALIGIAVIVLLIVCGKVHAFLALMFGSAVMALTAGVSLTDCFTSFTSGLGSTMGDVGVLIVLGSMIGTLLIDSGGADRIVDTIVSHTKDKWLPMAAALIAFIMGIALFFEVGVVLMVPIIMTLAKRKNMPAILLGIPVLAALGSLHGFVPPHPGPLLAINAIGANLGITLGLGLLVAIPTVLISGPLVAPWMAKMVPVKANDLYADKQNGIDPAMRPSFGAALGIVVLPVALMLLHAVFEIIGLDVPVVTFFGKPIVALLTAVVYGVFVLGMHGGKKFKDANAIVAKSFAPVAGVIMIVGAGGGFKQTLIDSGIATAVGGIIANLAVPAFFAAWLVAVFIRLATGSATVSTITAAGLIAPMVQGGTPIELSLVVLAIGAGSMFFSHVNDGGFWMIKEYFGLTMGQTFKTWSLTSTLISVVGLACIALLSLIF
jgi:GntP family gluconate:H+ symporter